MGISVIVGAQYGDEGKSKVARWFGEKYGVSHVVKIGGYTSKSTFLNNEEYVCHMLPAAANFYNSTIYLFPRCSYIILDDLWKECKDRIIGKDHILIDPYALVSVSKDDPIVCASEVKEIKDNITDIHDTLINLIASQYPYEILVEADGGYGLSTSASFSPQINRAPTMTASGIAYLLDINPSDIDDVLLVAEVTTRARRYQNSGNDLSEKDMVDRMLLSEKEGMLSNDSFTALSSELKGIDIDLIRNAYISANPDFFIVNGIDRISPDNEDSFSLTPEQHKFLHALRYDYGLHVDSVGVGPNELLHLKYRTKEDESGDNASDFVTKISEEAKDKFIDKDD